METTDLGSVLGIASGVSASVVMVCIAIGLTARFRHQHQQQQRNNNTTTSANGTAHHQAANGAPKASANAFVEVPSDEPDIILNNTGNNRWRYLHACHSLFDRPL